MNSNKAIKAAIIVAALGYFVDVYDLVLFLVIGKQSLLDIGVSAVNVISEFEFLLNIQMIGMLIGGVFWGVLGDKKGRLSVLFGSIITYSLANIANGFVHDTTTYAVLRFIAGVGLAGELGAGITLISEIMDKKSRGYGTMIVASVGVMGAVVAGLVAKVGWQTSYFIGGGLGLSLLLLRIGVTESGMFHKLESNKVEKGDFFMLFKSKEIFLKYLYCITIGLPVWYIIGKLVGLGPVFAKNAGIIGDVTDGNCVMLCYTGLIVGDIASGAMSQWLQSRKKVFYFFFILCCVNMAVYLSLNQVSNTVFYTFITLMGFSVGFWAIFVTVASEQFGTNIRATVTTTVPNFVRGSLVPITLLFNVCKNQFGLVNGAYVMAILVMLLSFFALSKLKETFGKDLDYNE